MDWDDIHRIRMNFTFWRTAHENRIGTIEGGDGRLVTINHAPSVSYFSMRDPVMRHSYIFPGREALHKMISAWIEKARDPSAQAMPADFVPVFPKIFEGVPVRYYHQSPRDPNASQSRTRKPDSVTSAQQQDAQLIAERFEEEFWNGQPGIIGRATGPVSICSVSGYGLNAARDTPVIIVVCVVPDDPSAPVTMDFPRTYHGLAVEYRSAFDRREL